MTHAIAMGSFATIYITSFKKFYSSIQNLMGGIHRQHGDCIGLLSFFFTKENRLIISFSSK
jgi:hypothetical protein